MDAFGYLSVLISIVLGFSITQLLGSIAAMVRARDRIDWYWPLPLQIAALLLINVQVWWAMFGLRNMEHWTFAGFLVVLMQPISLYMMSAFITPDIPDIGRFNLRIFYFREKPWYFAAILLTLAISLIKDVFVIHGAVSPYDLAAHAIFASMAVAGLTSDSDTVQKILAPLLLLFFAAYIGILFVTLPS